MKLPQSLIGELAHDRLVPFVGSGVSLSVKAGLFPTWKQLLDSMADRLDQETKEDYAQLVRIKSRHGRLYEAAEEAFNALGKAAFNEIMRHWFLRDKPDDADLTLVQAVWDLQPAIIVTTNYDSVLQWAKPSAEPVSNDQLAELAEIFRASSADQPRVWHLHGHISRADTLILAPAQYDAFYRETPQTKQDYDGALLQLKSLLVNYSLLLVGFGLQDQYVMELLAGVLKIFGGNLRQSYALLKNGDTRTEELWKQFNIQAIDFDDYGPPLLSVFGEMAQQKARVPAIQPAESGGARMPLSIPIVPVGYTQWLQRQCGDVELLGLEVMRGQAITLKSVYVPLTTPAAPPMGDSPRDLPKSKKASALLPGRAEGDRYELLLEALDRESLYVSGQQLQKEGWALKPEKLRIEQPFWITRFPVTNGQHRLFIQGARLPDAGLVV